MDSDDHNVRSANQMKNKNKRSLSEEVFKTESVNLEKSTNSKQRRYDLICVVCQGRASGYNFDQISCSSCKEFFRRTALLPIEKTKCMDKRNGSFNIRCRIRFDIKQKCQRCRLLKCFESGMRTDHLVTPKEKLLKQQRIQENRLICSVQIIHESDPARITIGTKSTYLTETDRDLLSYIESAYLTAVRSIPPVSSVMSFEPSLNKTFSFADVIEIDKTVPIKLINFLRLIPEFEHLNNQDRFALVKYNILPLFVLRDLLVFDRRKGIFYDDNTINTSRSPNDEKFAHISTSLYILFYGYEETQVYISALTLILDSIDNDALLIKILMLVLIFLKGVSLNDEQIWVLMNRESVYKAHSKYVDLLYRYLLDRYPFDIAVIKMMRITETIFQIQKKARFFQELARERARYNEIHPLYKSLLGLT